MIMTDLTPEQLAAQHYNASLDSVNLIHDLAAKPSRTDEELDRIKANGRHLQTMLGRTFWTTAQDLSVLSAAVDVAASLVELGPPPAPEVPPTPISYTRVTKLAFRNRFTAAEKASIELAACDNPNAAIQDRITAAALRAQLADQRDASFIDLARDDTRAGVEMLETEGLLAAGRAAEILDAPVQADERYQ
jgi:hypothetical protein